MKTVGIIAEYNPFHNGHAYQIRRAKEETGADCAVIVMSGNYVQRGEPSVLDKFSRASMALQNGADLVFELPVLWATASAEYFAAAAVALFDKLGFIDFISFGCETSEFALFNKISEILAAETDSFSSILKEELRSGKNYPTAREAAVFYELSKHHFFSQTDTDGLCEKIHEILGSPNNILAIEYLKALKKRSSVIIPCPIQRTGAGYHETDMTASYASATGIRKLLFENTRSLEKELQPFVPDNVLRLLTEQNAPLLTQKDFSEMLYYKLFSSQNDGFADYGDSSEYLSNRIVNHLNEYINCSDFCMRLKTKDVTYTRLCRLLLHILLNLKQADYTRFQSLDYILYFRPLGFTKKGASLLSLLKKNDLPIITKPSAAKSLLTEEAFSLYQTDVSASNLYYGTVAQKYGLRQKKEEERQILTFF